MGRSAEGMASRLVWALALAAIAAHVVAFDAAGEQDITELLDADDNLAPLNKLHLQNARLSGAIRQLEAGGSITAAANSGRAAAAAAGVTAGAARNKAKQDCKAIAIKQTMSQVKPIMQKFMATTQSLSRKYKRALKQNRGLRLKVASKKCPKCKCKKCKSAAELKLELNKAVKNQHAQDKLRYKAKKMKLEAQMKDMYFKDTDTMATIRKKNKKLIKLVHANGAHFVAQVNAAKFAAKATISSLHTKIRRVLRKARVAKSLARVKCAKCSPRTIVRTVRVVTTKKKTKKSVCKVCKRMKKKAARKVKKEKKKLKKEKKKLKKAKKKAKKAKKKAKKAKKKAKKKIKKAMKKIKQGTLSRRSKKRVMRKVKKLIKKAWKAKKKEKKKMKKAKKKIKKAKKKIKKEKKKIK